MEEEQPGVDGEQLTGQLFQTAVSDDQLREARNKSYRRIFGSSQVFLDSDDKPRQGRPCLFQDIIKGKVAEHCENGLRSMHQGEWEKAVISFSKAITLDPEKVDLYVKRAQAFLQLCDFQSAVLNLQKACSVAPRKKT
uniref:Uncharacterized protein n=1 Tax=Leptobrachium leishanense TaxID=445787 RepID=A0A8C5PG83_9ANUR